MKVVAYILPAVAVLVSTTVICADVPIVSASQDDQPVLSFQLQSDRCDMVPAGPVESPRPVRQAPPPDSNPRYPMDMAFGVGAVRPGMDFSTSIPPEPGPKTIVLPADMSSLTMFLTGIGSLGAWQFVRSARGGKFHFGHCQMPEWYHTGGPLQVGHAVAINPHLQPQALCVLETPISGPALAHRLAKDVPLRCEPQFSPTLTAPRGPPPVHL